MNAMTPPRRAMPAIQVPPAISGTITVIWRDCFSLTPDAERQTFLYAGPFERDTLLRSALHMRELATGSTEAAAREDVDFAMRHEPVMLGVLFHQDFNA